MILNLRFFSAQLLNFLKTISVISQTVTKQYMIPTKEYQKLVMIDEGLGTRRESSDIRYDLKLPPDMPNGNRRVPGGCAICLRPYDKGDQVSWSSQVAEVHAFHTGCIITWICKGNHHEHNFCPCCRKTFVYLGDGPRNKASNQDPELPEAAPGNTMNDSADSACKKSFLCVTNSLPGSTSLEEKPISLILDVPPKPRMFEDRFQGDKGRDMRDPTVLEAHRRMLSMVLEHVEEEEEENIVHVEEEEEENIADIEAPESQKLATIIESSTQQSIRNSPTSNTTVQPQRRLSY